METRLQINQRLALWSDSSTEQTSATRETLPDQTEHYRNGYQAGGVEHFTGCSKWTLAQETLPEIPLFICDVF